MTPLAHDKGQLLVMSGKSSGQFKKCQAKSQSSVDDISTSKSNANTDGSKESSDKLAIDEAFLKKIFEKIGDNPNDWTKCNAIRLANTSGRSNEKDKPNSKICHSKSGLSKQSDSNEKVKDLKKSSNFPYSSTEKGIISKSSSSTSEVKEKTNKESSVVSKANSNDTSKDSKDKDHHNRKQKKSHQGDKRK